MVDINEKQRGLRCPKPVGGGRRKPSCAEQRGAERAAEGIGSGRDRPSPAEGVGRAREAAAIGCVGPCGAV